MTDLTVIILTKNEERHIARAIASIADFATRIVIVDSGSTDQTVQLAQAAGAETLYNPWTNHATQFNWALDQIANQPGWILRLDADEIVSPALRSQIKGDLPNVDGVYVRRCMNFMGQPIRYGGLFAIRTLRLFRNGRARAEHRWMDEHIVVQGTTADLTGQIIDDNLRPLDWWIEKHNGYASLEVIDILNQQYRFLPASNPACRQAGIKRWIKQHVYARLPIGLRAGAYFFYRYVLRLGFLDGPQARCFHIFQGFWYRYLVDAKLAEVRRFMAATGATPADAIADVLGVVVDPDNRQTHQVAA